MKTQSNLLILLSGIAFAAAAHIQASTIIFDSFGPGDSYDINEGASVCGPNSVIGLFSSGFSFVPATTLSLDTIQVAVGTIGGTNAFSLQLQAGNGASGGPGTVLENILVSGQMQPFGFANPLISVTSVARPVLQAGNTYWLVAVGEDDAWAAWDMSNLGLRGMYYSIQGGQEVLLSDQLITAFRITGDAVPEPALPGFIALFAISTILVASRRHAQNSKG